MCQNEMWPFSQIIILRDSLHLCCLDCTDNIIGSSEGMAFEIWPRVSVVHYSGRQDFLWRGILRWTNTADNGPNGKDSTINSNHFNNMTVIGRKQVRFC